MDTQQINSSDLPVYDKPQLPTNGHIILLTEEPNYGPDGGKIQLAYQLPLDRLVPNNAVQKVSYSLQSVSSDINVPSATVVPAYVETFEPYTIQRANGSDDTTRAQFLIVGLNPNIDDSYIIQKDGYYSFPTVHNYEVGQKYYLSPTVNGGVTTTPPPDNPQVLFLPVDRKTIQILLGD